MQHTEIDRTLTVERYLLGEMTGTELDDFEEHVFSCRQCAEDVRSGATFLDNARAVFHEEGQRQPVREEARAPRWWQRFTLPVLAPAFASVLLVCVVGYQRLVVIPGLEQQVAESSAPQSLSAFALHSAARGAQSEIKAPSASRFTVYFDVATPSPSGYSCEFRDASGAVRLAVPAQAMPGGTVYLMLGRAELPAGDYTLVVKTAGPDAKELSQYPFKLEYQ